MWLLSILAQKIFKDIFKIIKIFKNFLVPKIRKAVFASFDFNFIFTSNEMGTRMTSSEKLFISQIQYPTYILGLDTCNY